jgi:4-amino-4-deoxy-L-arabinose transferase-like glycosyltransferase
LGALSLLTSFGFLLSTRFLIMDGLLTLFTTFALLSLYIATRGASLARGWWLAAAVACGLGVMTKGPVALVLSLPPLFAVRWLSQSGAAIRWRDWAWFGGAFTLVTAPWFVAATIQDSSFLKHFFWTHHVMRYTTTFAHAAPWWFYGLVLAVGLFPTCMLFPAMILYLRSKTPSLRAARTWEQGYLLFAAAWVVIFFSMSRGKLPPYVLPALPMLCLALGAMLDRGLLSRVADAQMDLMRKALPFHGTRIVLIAGMVVGVVDAAIDGWAPSRWLDGAAISCAAAGLFYFVSRKSFAGRPAQWIAAAAIPLLLMAVGLIHIYPQIAVERSTAERVSQFRAEYQDPATPAVSFQLDHDSTAFYNRGIETRKFESSERPSLLAYLMARPQTLLVTTPDAVRLLRGELPSTLQIEQQPDSRDRVYLVRQVNVPATNVSAVPPKVEKK